MSAQPFQPLFLFLKALGPGERWITVRPPGHEKGQPVLIRENPDGSASVIGGAGGKLNYLRLRGVKSRETYKQEAKQRAEGRRDERKAAREQEKASGQHEAKSAARQALREEVGKHEREFVSTVAEAMGWKPEDLEFPEHLHANASAAAVAKARKRHAQALLKRAREAVGQQRQRLVLDAEARHEAGLGEVPLTTAKADHLSTEDLVDSTIPGSSGLGFAPAWGERAQAAGLTDAELKREADGYKDPDRVAATSTRRDTAAAVAKELKEIRHDGPAIDSKALVDAKQAVELLKAEKLLREARKQAAAKAKEIDDAAVVEPKAYVLEVSADDINEAVSREIESDLRTLKTRAFLDELGSIPGGRDSVGRHVAVGAYNSVNSVALAVGGTSMLDRSVVDVLGVAGAAQVLARRLQSDLTAEEMDDLRDAMGRFHVDHYMKLSDEALAEARDWQEIAQEIEVGEAASGNDLAKMQELNAKRRDAIGKSRRALGVALGEMEANAALVKALSDKNDEVQVSLGKVSIEQAIVQARAIGLDRGDYHIETVGANRFLTVHGAGMDKLAAPVSREDLERVNTAMDIINGRQDEDDWLPIGVADRPDLAMEVPPGVAPRLAEPFEAGEELAQSIRDYIGGRTADGDPPADILADLLSQDIMERVGDRRGQFMAALDKIAPARDAKGKMIRAESHQEAFEALADDFVQRRHGEARAPLHRQHIQVDQVSVDALHRALADEPAGVAAFKPIGEMDHREQRALRDVFVRDFAKDSPEAATMRADLDKLESSEPEREVEDMFGVGTNPAWTDWKQRRDELSAKLNESALTWQKYVKVMGGPAKAYGAMQDHVRSAIAQRFADAHNTLRPDQPVKLGRTVIRGNLDHLDAVDPDARERRLDEHRSLIDRLRNRIGGRYSGGSVADKIAEARDAQEAFNQSQMGFFATEDEPEADQPLAADERHTLGHAVERQLAGMMHAVGKNFRPGEKTEIWRPTMSGKFAGRQRAVKLIQHNKRMMLGMGTGSGKTSISLAAFTHLHGQGLATRGLFLVPSVAQAQFGGDARTMLEPGKYQWHCEPGADRTERIKAYRDPENHFVVATHQAFRDDMLHLAAKREQMSEEAVAEKISGMKPSDRTEYMRDLMQAEGINVDYLTVDEGHNLLNRAGKADSHMANIIDAVSSTSPYYVNMTADPIKNDTSEMHDVLRKMDPERYADREAFMRKYGVDTQASRDGLRREMSRHFYTEHIKPDIHRDRKEIPVALSDDQHKRIADIDAAVTKVRLARMRGSVDVASAKSLSPQSFEGVPEAQHEEVAKRLAQSIGVLRDSALSHALNSGAKTDHVLKFAEDRRGKPGVVFAHGLSNVREITDRLRKAGHRVVTITGADSAADKSAARRSFQGSDGEAGADILVASDAGAVGLNAQRGEWLLQYDTPPTAMVHAQRNGRIDRIGQRNGIELADLVADHPLERQNRDRLARKYDLRELVTSPLDGLDDTGIAGYLNRSKPQGGQEALF